jgi:hypothetical protein
MADLLNFKVEPTAAVQVNVPGANIEGTFVDSGSQQNVIADFTGDNRILWPSVLTTLTPEQRGEILGMVAMPIMRMKAGLQ